MALDLDIGRIGIWSAAPIWERAGGEAAEAASELEELGYGALWLGRSAGDLAVHRALVEATNRLVLASGIINIWTEPAEVVAASYTAIERDHPGRIVVGLGSSHAPIVESVTSQKYEKPLSRLREYLDELDELEPTVPRGRRVLAALGPRALKLAAERSAGAHPYLVTPAHTRKAREILGPDALLAPEATVVVESDPDTARALGREMLSLYLGLPNYTNNFLREGFDESDFADGASDRLVDALIAWGDPDTIAARIAEHHDAGADHVAVQVVTGGDRGTAALPREQWRELAAALEATA
jgi:probable F420-dependent oxidoreductase